MRRFLVVTAAVVTALIAGASGGEGREPHSRAHRETPRTASVGQASLPASDAGAEWQRFRSLVPYHLQTIAASAPSADGGRTLILSEPPPHVTLEEFKGLDPALADAGEHQYTVGHDGWVKDIVVPLPELETEAFDRLVGRIGRYAFHTDYKSHCVPLPLDPNQLATKYPLDLRVGAAELQAWLQNGAFVDSDGGQVLLADLAKSEGGVYYSRDPGLVLWDIPSTGRIDDRKEDIRRFAMDSDIIIGAAKVSSGVVLVCARERITPVSAVPPLRTEGVCLVASEAGRTAELAQSYERDAPLAGRLVSGWDWAPAFLSDALIDTEFGSILNIADQLLKSWTQHGGTRYHNFGYPDPSRFPFDRQLSDVLDISDSLLFNWNTTGFGCVTDIGDLKVFSLTRTGALPVIYRPDDSELADTDSDVRQAEEDAYDYFATRNEPVLARVVQYTALYQCFRVFGVTAAPAPRNTLSASAVVARHLTGALQALRGASPENMMDTADAAASEFERLCRDLEWAGKTVPARQAREMTAGYRLQIYTEFLELRNAFKAYQDRWGRDGIETAVEIVCASPTELRGISVPADMTPAEMEHLGDLADLLRSKSHSINLWADIPAAMSDFSAAMDSGASRWLHTQTVVVSCNAGATFGGIGGHNVAAEVTAFRASSSVPAGTLKRAADGIIECNPDDTAKLRQIVRLAAEKRDSPELVESLSARMRELRTMPASSQRATLALGDREAGAVVRGFDLKVHVPGPGAGDGGRLPPIEPPTPGAMPPPEPPRRLPGNSSVPRSAAAEDWTRMLPDGLHLDRDGGRTCVYRLGPEGQTVGEAWNVADAAYAVVAELKAGGRRFDLRSLRVSFGEGFSKAEAERFMETVRVQASRYETARRMLIFGPLTPKGVERLSTSLASARPGTAFAVHEGTSGVRITGDLMCAGGNTGEFRLGIVIQSPPSVKALSADRVNTIVAENLADLKPGKTKPVDLGEAIYDDIANELFGGERGTGVLKIDDVGDIQILLKPESWPQEESRHDAQLSGARVPPRGSNLG